MHKKTANETGFDYVMALRTTWSTRLPPRDAARIDITENEVRLWGLTRREYILAALEAIDQAGLTPATFAEAYRHARGKPERLLEELEEKGT